MHNEKQSFLQIFNSDHIFDNEVIQLQKIVIPMIQRDYAQGRQDPEVSRVRERFLEALYRAIIDEPITLDFIYGDIDKSGIMTPLDGQQRLTTLFLLHWYAAKKENVSEEEYLCLGNFSYETRYSARDFCEHLISFQPTFSRKISEEIIDQSWFPLDWKKDSTVSSMLVMLDEIDKKFSGLDHIWDSLKNNAITFYFLPIKDMGLTDELYIKMNSRGKPLTQFEHFKAELEQQLKKIDEHIARRIIKKIDVDWTDMLWDYRGSNHVIDDEFLRYFRFICDIITYKKEESTIGKKNDEFSLLEEHFTDSVEAKQNIQLLEEYFDCWCELSKQTKPEVFFKTFLAKRHEKSKIRVDFTKLDIFGECLENYIDEDGRRTRAFPLARTLLLYAFITFLLNRDTVSDEQFIRRIRIVNNLIQNSDNEISDNPSRASGNTMSALMMQIDSIITRGIINDSLSLNFNVNQLAEEKEKEKWIINHPQYVDDLYRLEDHELLYGQIGIVGLENPKHFPRFSSLFQCDRDLISCALMSIGEYYQRERNQWRYQLGSENSFSWRELFHKSSNSGYENTKKILSILLEKSEEFTDKMLEDMKDKYIEDCEKTSEFDWRYYYLKYNEFRPDSLNDGSQISYGKYSWRDPNKPYEMRVMLTRVNFSNSSYQPFLAEVDKKNIAKNYYGNCLIINEQIIECLNHGFVFKRIDDDALIREIPIKQNESGVDMEDRIEKLKRELISLHML